MKLNLRTVILLLPTILIFNSCNSKIDIKPVQPTSESVFVTGKVLNPNPANKTITIYVNEILSGDQMTYVSLVDNTGDFQIKFNRYYPQDILVRYGDDAFPMIIHPTDSIHIVFDADKISDKDELAKTIQFSGSFADENSKLVVFHSEISKIFIPWDQYCLYEKEKSPDEFKSILDSLKTAKSEVANEFIKQGVSKELEEWIRNEVDFDYYNWLARYPYSHAKFNNTDEKTVVPTSFYDFMNIKFLPEFLNNSKSIDFVGRYRAGRISSLMVDEGKLYKLDERWAYKGDASKAIISTILKNTKDTILNEILIARQLYNMLDMREIKEFEKHLSLFEETVKLPFLREPLINKYAETKKHFEHPQQEENTLLKLVKDTPANELIATIIKEHQGKIIYLDIWATWCSPCRKEMPFSKELEKSLNSDKVDFAYLCIDSKEDKWKALISEIGIEGSNYLATDEQSRFIYQLFEMDGVPQYILIDTHGNIVDKGFQLRPSESLIKTKIENLLKQ